MENFTIVYHIKLPVHGSVPEKYQGTIQVMELDIEELEWDDLTSHIIQMGWMTSWGNNRKPEEDYKIVDRYIK